ncbi:MAG: efflux RND transporter permease subunit [Desulfuromonadaceae bacterium]|nr:efflux RND transporter permease subunit [Desulfuromonadaceae bacterium]
MIRFFTQHPTSANLLMLVFLVMGILTVKEVRRESLPDVTPSEVEIKILYPGASALEVEEAIVNSVEDAVDGVRFVEEVRSEAREGVAIITIEMTEGGDFPTFKDDIESEVDAIDNFPAGVETPVITQLGTKDQVLAVIVSGATTDIDLKNYCDVLKEKIKTLPGISLVDVKGFSERQLRVELSPQALMRHGLSTTDIVNAIKQQSINNPVGDIKTQEQEILLRFVEQRRDSMALESLVITGAQGGGEILLGDLASISDTFEFAEEKILFKGRRAGKIIVSKTKTEDSLRIADTVRYFIAQEQQRQPNIDFYITEDGSRGLRDRLELVVSNGIQGIVLVLLIMWLFFQFRMSFWVVMGLPVAFLGAMAFMPALHLTINLMTLVGFLLALGILMDDAIVIAENIVTHLQRGKTALQAALDGVLEVKNGVFSSFLTTVCVLGPLSFISGDIGKLLRVVPMILILVLAVSLVEAFLILPSHLAHSLHNHDLKDRSRFRQQFEQKFEYFREHFVGRSVDKIIEFRYLFLGCLMCLLLISVGMITSGILPFQALPKLEGDVVVARVLMPAGTPLSKTEMVVDQLVTGLEKMNTQFTAEQPENQQLVLGSNIQFNLNADAFETGAHVATISVDLLTADERYGRIDDYLDVWRQETGAVPDALSIVMSESSNEPAGRAIEIRVAGRDLTELTAAVGEIRQWFSQFAGVNNLLDDLRPGKRELKLTIKEGASGLGLDAVTMSQQLNAAFQGMTADEFQLGSNAYSVDVQLHKNLQKSVDDLNYFHFKTPDGQQVPLPAVLSISEELGWARIAHVNGVRTVTLRGDVDTAVANSAKLINQFKREFLPAIQADYPDLNIAFEGQEKNAKTTQKSIVRGILLGLIGVFILLSFQFRNYREPLIVMVIIPFALIGVVGGHLLMGMPFTLPSLLGFVSLAGIVVNDSILLVLFIKKELEEGADVFTAATQASRARFRAVLLTSITTIAGMLPLLFETSLQAQIIQPLAISIAFGLMATTVLVLYVVPGIYVVLDDFGVSFMQSNRTEKKERNLTI